MVAMENEALIAIYDEFRRSAMLQGWMWEADRGEGWLVERQVAADGTGLVVYAEMAAERVNEVIQAEKRLARQREGGLEWLVYAHDEPAEVGAQLEAAGFAVGPAETVLVLPVAEMQVPAADEAIDVRRVREGPDLAAVAAIRAETWGGDAEAMARRLAAQLGARGEEVAVYVAAVEGEVAATAQITFYPEQQFASVVMAATRPAYRRRGLYRALLRARLLEAQARGVRFVDTEASEMSRPLLERVGFRPISTVRVYEWEPGGGS